MKVTISIAFLAGLPAAIAASGDPAAILARAKEATGGSAWDAIKTTHVKGKVATGGLDGTFESWEDVLTGRYVQKFAIGPMTGAEGFDGKTGWDQDPSGQSKPRDGDEAKQETANSVYERTMGYWFRERHAAEVVYKERREEDGKSFDVLTITPEGGRGFDMWLDAKTSLMDRTVEKTATETRTSYVSDYRKVQGVLLPFRSRTTTGDPKYDVLGEVIAVELNPKVDEAAFAMPAPPPPDFAIAGGATSVTVPFELLNNHIYVDVTLNGKGPFKLLCDTGGANVATPDLARELSLQGMGAFEGKGVGESSEEIAMAKVATLGIGDATVKDQLFAIFPLAGLDEAEGVPEKGIVGYEVFKRFVVTIDYGKSQLTLTLPSAYRPSGTGTTVPFEFHESTPQVEGEIDGIAGKFTIDTGSRASLDLHVPFAKKHDLKARYAPKVEGVTGWGVGGAARSLVTRCGSLRIGPAPGVTVEKPVTELSVQRGGAYTDEYVAGNIGGGILKRFTLVFDYGKQTITFVPNPAAEIDGFDRAGMWLNLAKDGAFAVIDVFAGTPAAEAGLKAGDRITAIDGKTSRDVTLPRVRARLRNEPPGTKVRLEVETGGKTREVTLVLRDLV
ncbi:MAG: aspartyl protease family protein [Acidobacteriota bacterium]